MLKAQNASLRASDDASQLEGRSSSDIYDLKLTESELYILVSAVNDSLSRPVSSGGIWLKKGVDEAAALLRRLSIVAFGYPDEPVPWTAVQRVEWVHALDASNAALRAMGVEGSRVVRHVLHASDRLGAAAPSCDAGVVSIV